MLRIAVLASGGGTNLQALIDHFNGRDGGAAAVALVISDREGAGALERARRAGIPAHVVPAKGREPDVAAAELLARLDAERIDMVALAGYLRLVPDRIVQRFRGRIVNIHPALLPAFGGAGMYGIRVHRAVIESGCTVTGVTVHHVDERYDEGRTIVQWPVPVLRGDTAEALAARVLRVEHALYPAAIESLARRLAAGPDVAREGAGTSGFAATDPAAFEWTSDEGVESTLRRLLEIEGDPEP